MIHGFAEKYGISYPLLSDEGSKVIRQLGILNEGAAEQVFGIPHPGTFVLDGDGTIRSKHFYASYRERDTGVGVLEHLLGLAAFDGDGAPHGVAQDAASEGVTVKARLDSESFAWGQRIWLSVEFAIAPGLHVYGRPIPDGYYPLEVVVEPIERVVIGEPQLPAASPFRVDGLDEEFVVYEGTVKVQIPLTFMVVDAGALEVAVTISYQACTATECLMPTSLRLALPIAERSLVERVKPT